MNLPKSREVVYIAGPFTAEDRRQIVRNCNNAHFLALRVRALGYTPFVPHTGLAGGIAELSAGELIYELPDLGWELSMVDCRALLPCFQAVLMVEGWETSRGATEERELAKAYGIPVFDTFSELVAAGLGIHRREVVNEPHA
ncbi:MAG TPA: DUF4406 domain-containing protein [Holophagaceae bacterium]|nr:DUF4406 domain-containing protein [Holophagaceae bacterium]